MAVAIFVVMLMFVDCVLPPHPAKTDTQLGRPSDARRGGSFVQDVGFSIKGIVKGSVLKVLRICL